MSKNLDKTVRLQSEKGEEWIREIRRERQQRIAEGASSAPRLASSSAASFPGRKKKTVPAGSSREFEIKGKTEKRTGWRRQNESQRGGEEKRNYILVGAARTSGKLAEW